MINFLNPNFNLNPGIETKKNRYTLNYAQRVRPEVSIITPYYNTSEIFKETFNSIIGQTLQNFEWIIIDDGSDKQDSVERLIEITKNDERIRIYRQNNLGPSIARNTGFKKSNSEYICLIDSDDLIESSYLEKCVWFLESNSEFSFCNTRSVIFGEQEYLFSNGFEQGKKHLKANVGPINSVIRRKAYSEINGFDDSIRMGHEDWDFWLRMANAGHWGYTIPEYLQWIRRRNDGRFSQVMATENLNEKFENLMHERYAKLENSFPSPIRRHEEPYQTISTEVPVINPLRRKHNTRSVLFIVPWMVTGGADRVNLELIEGLAENNCDVCVCATISCEQVWEHQFCDLTDDVFVLPNFLHTSDYARFLIYLINSRTIDTVIITGSTLGYNFLPILKSICTNVAFLDMSHAEESHWLNGGHPRFGVGYQDVLDLNIVTTRSLLKWMRSRGADTDRIRVLYTGIHSDRNDEYVCKRSEIRNQFHLSEDTPLIIFAGRMCAQKRPILLANILHEMANKGYVFKAVIIGSGELSDELTAYVNNNNMRDIVYLLGSVTHERWLSTLAASDILLMPSKYEGISIALLEALNFGVVPVVANVGGHDELIDDTTGILVNHGLNEIRDYVNGLGKLFNMETRNEMSKKCKQLAESKLSWNSMIGKFLEIIEDAHRLNLADPRNKISLSFGKEHAVSALEVKRLGDAVEWLWNNKKQDQPIASKQLNIEDGNNIIIPVSNTGEQAVVNYALAVSRTRIGQFIVHNKVMQNFAKKIMRMN